MTHWSLTNRPTCYGPRLHANRLLKSVHKLLSENATRVFAEWHMNLNYSHISTIEQYVRNMVSPAMGLRFYAFTILRPATSLVTSSFAYFLGTQPAEITLRFEPEYLLQRLLASSEHTLDNSARTLQSMDGRNQSQWLRASLTTTAANRSSLPPCPIGSSSGSGGEGSAPTSAATNPWNWTTATMLTVAGGESICHQSAAFRAVLRLARGQDAHAQHRARASLASGQERVADTDYAEAWYKAGIAAGIREHVATASACNAVVGSALGILSQLDHVLRLEDAQVFQIIQSVARGNFSFQPPSLEAQAKFTHTLRSAQTNPQYLAQYTTPWVSALAGEQNVCSKVLYDQLVAGAHVKRPVTLLS